MSTKKLQLIGSLGTKIYSQNDEPTDAQDGALWIDLDEEALGVSSNAVLYTTQSLTDEQKAQTLLNLGVSPFENPNIRAVNHRGYNTTAPENTLSAYRLSREMGFKFVECDVKQTKDGVPVLLHDDTVDRTSNGTGNLADMTFDEVRALDFGSWKGSDYAGEKIPTFEEFIILCKHIGLHPYIELKGASAVTLMDTVKRYGMVDSVTWISFSSSVLDSVKNLNKKARLGLIVSEVTESTIEWAVSAKTDINDVFIDANVYNLTAEQVGMCIDNDIPLEVWTVNYESQMLNLDKYVSGYTSDNLFANTILYDAPIPESEAPLDSYVIKYGQLNVIDSSYVQWQSNGNRANLLSSISGLEIYKNTDGEPYGYYVPVKPTGTTKMTVVCPNLKYAVREYTVADTVTRSDSGWLAFGGSEYTYRNAGAKYIDCVFATESGATPISATDLATISVAFE